ncbi:hypothetical protein KSP40_PGU020798 [Platanthera guangdongensis]|uniref:Uncharacterized protein n=1 Tax=Platanthera guangdongensis TaxID=2320717 RepID=A0ABR2MZF5_9ASPA
MQCISTRARISVQVLMQSQPLDVLHCTVDDIKDEGEAWLKKIAEEWELIMPEEGIIHTEKANGQKKP